MKEVKFFFKYVLVFLALFFIMSEGFHVGAFLMNAKSDIAVALGVGVNAATLFGCTSFFIYWFCKPFFNWLDAVGFFGNSDYED
jgi:hypothetical protein